MIKKSLGILMLALTLLSGITVLAQNTNNSTTMKEPSMSGQSHRRHHRRHHRRGHRRGGMNKNKNMK